MPQEPWYRRGARGALAGAGATVAMSAVQFPGAWAGGRKPPPLEITRRLHLAGGHRPERRNVVSRGTALHLAFGAGCGALYAIAAPRRLRELSATAFAGVLYGISYRASLPALGLHAHSRRDDTRRQASNAASHLVYGLTLAELLRWTDPPEGTDGDDRDDH